MKAEGIVFFKQMPSFTPKNYLRGMEKKKCRFTSCLSSTPQLKSIKAGNLYFWYFDTYFCSTWYDKTQITNNSQNDGKNFGYKLEHCFQIKTFTIPMLLSPYLRMLNFNINTSLIMHAIKLFFLRSIQSLHVCVNNTSNHHSCNVWSHYQLIRFYQF